jgi:hypothetical protein
MPARDEGEYASATRATTSSMPGSARTNKAGRCGKAIGISVPADVDDDDDTMYNDDGTGYIDAATHDDNAVPEQTGPSEAARQVACPRWPT